MNVGIVASVSIWFVFRTTTALDLRTPSRPFLIFFAWYAIFIMAAEDLPLPTGPETRDTNASDVRKPARDFGGV
jgi:hypothetical protein